MFLRVFDEVENFGHRGVVKLFVHPHFEVRSHIDGAAHHRVAFRYFAGKGLSRQGARVERGRAFHHRAVKRHFFAGIDGDYLADFHLGRVHGHGPAVAEYVGAVGAYVHKP